MNITEAVLTELHDSLLSYRLTPQTTTSSSPAEMLLGWRPRSHLDLLKLNTADRVEKKQWAQKSQHDQHAKGRVFVEKDTVFVRNYHSGDKWLPGVITQKTGPVSFKVKMTTGQERWCHQDQMRARSIEVTTPDPQDLSGDSEIPTPRVELNTPQKK